MTNLLLILSALCIVSCVHAYPKGAPPSACSDLVPSGHPKSELKKSLYTIGSGCYVIFKGDSMKMWIQDLGEGGPFKGLLLMVRDDQNRSRGSWSIDAKDKRLFKTIKCSDADAVASAVTHTSRVLKDPADFRFTWTAPTDCQRNEKFYIEASVVKQFKVYQTKLKVNMVCDPDYSDANVMIPVRPPTPTAYCGIGNWAIIPKNATEDFESQVPFDGWKNMYLAQDSKWLRWTGKTPSDKTGPSVAQQGDYYLYFEGTGKYRTQMSAYYSPPLQGCMCLTFWCHMNTDRTAIFTLSAVGVHVRTLVSTSVVTNFWRKMEISLLTDYPITLVLQVFRGVSFASDVGIDNIRVVPGVCTSPAALSARITLSDA